MMYIVLALLGLCFGSFVNALVWRLHKQSKSRSVLSTKYSVLKGRSMCVHCHHVLAWYDLLPVVSWVLLGGKCRYCRKPISWQYPAVELLTAGLFMFSYAYFPYDLTLLPLWMVILTGLIALAVYDIRWMLLPNRLVFPLQALAAVYVTMAASSSGSYVHTIWQAVLGVIFSAGLFYLLFQVSRGTWIGGGDVKLAVVLGLVLGGAVESLLMIFVASLLGSLVGIPLVLAGKTKLQGKIPFGPLLIAATVIVYLFGSSLISWYKNQLLLP